MMLMMMMVLAILVGRSWLGEETEVKQGREKTENNLGWNRNHHCHHHHHPYHQHDNHDDD